MELRLFLIACVMYGFTWFTRWLQKDDQLTTYAVFGKWHGSFIFVILSCALYIALFVMRGGTGEPFPLNQFLILELVVILLALFGYSYAQQLENKKKDALVKKDLDWCNTVYFAGFMASIVMFFFVQAFKIPSASMRNTLVEGDHLFVDKSAYGFRIPFTQKWLSERKVQRGDIIVFEFPAKSRMQLNCGETSQYGRDFVKRVVALPGETVEVKDGHLWVDGKETPQQPYEIYENVNRTNDVIIDDSALYQRIWQQHKLDNYLSTELRDNFGPVKVPANNYFVMGDNRDNSCDSRFWGPVPRENIKGKAWFIHWPLKKIGLIK